jgi:Bacterial PH domain
MIERLGAAIRRALRVPPPPSPPAGRQEATRVFHAARGFYHLRLFEWALAQIVAVAGIGLGLAFSELLPDMLDQLIGGYIRLAESLGLAVFAFQFFFSLVVLHLDYRLRWYIITDRSLRIREGVLRVRELTVSFANIQNVSVRQGPLQRWLGIADVEVRTAGGGGGGSGHAAKSKRQGSDLHRALFRAIDNAPEIRDRILRDVRRLRATEAEDASAAETPPPDLLAPARDLADAARALRVAVAR